MPPTIARQAITKSKWDFIVNANAPRPSEISIIGRMQHTTINPINAHIDFSINFTFYNLSLLLEGS